MAFVLSKIVFIWYQRHLYSNNSDSITQGISPIAKIAIAISIFIKFGIAIAISIAIWFKIADRDRSFAIADRLGDLFSY